MRARILRALAHLKAAQFHLKAAQDCFTWREPDELRKASISAVPQITSSQEILKGYYATAVFQALECAELPK